MNYDCGSGVTGEWYLTLIDPRSGVRRGIGAPMLVMIEQKYSTVKEILGLFTTLVGSAAFELHVHGLDDSSVVE